MKVIILAAGKGSRMGPITDSTPKPMLMFGNLPIIVRLIRQISCFTRDINVVVGYKKTLIIKAIVSSFNFKINFVSNEEYGNDINILSVYKGIDQKNIKNGFYIFEADCVYNDDAINKIFSNDIESKSSWFSLGSFNELQNGGIIRSCKSHVNDIKIVSKYTQSYKGYNKLIGILKVGPKEALRYYEALKSSIKKTTKQYYLQPWIDNLSNLPCIETKLKNYVTGAFNTIEDYQNCMSYFKQQNELYLYYNIELLPVKSLTHIEGFSIKREKWLRKKILNEGRWSVPLKVDSEYKLVMDGQHRMEVAKNLDLKFVPCIVYKYLDVKVWSLRKEYEVTQSEIINNYKKNYIYPYKTAKHKFPHGENIVINYKLEELK